VCYVLITSIGADAWGADRLHADETIPSGNSRTFNLPEGSYDVRIATCEHGVMATAWHIDGDTTVTVGDRGADVRLLLINESLSEVCFVMISPTTAEYWGDDWMGELEILPSGLERIFYLVPDVYDLQVLNCDGEVLTEEYAVDLTEDLSWTLTD
jgi:hypothetical protein